MYFRKKKTTAPSSMSMLSSLSSISSTTTTTSSSLMFVFLLSFFSFITFTPVSADGNTYIINNASDFIDFAKKVNNDGTTFSGTTVFLSDDIDFSSCSGNFEPVGNYSDNIFFTGTFDGQGHTITNLVVNSSNFRHTGLFGYSKSLTIKNLIIDSSCSFASYYNRSSYSDAFVSSVIGSCETSGNTCTIESVVNMAGVSYHYRLWKKHVIVGGIVAKCTGNCSLSNIVNFGSVLTASEKSSNCIYSGGIVGEVEGKSGFVSIKNCINYGTVINSIKGNEYILVGGITGVVWSNVAIENCLATGSVSSVKSSNSYTGGIIGGIKTTSSLSPSSNNTISNCFWTESVGGLNASGEVINDSKIVIENTSITEMNESGIATIRDTMNNGTSSECGWVAVHLNGGGFGNSTQEDILIMQKSLIADPVKEGHSFVTWCNDTNCTKSCNSSSVSECTSAELYAAWTINNYTLTIDFANGTVVDVEVEFNSTINITKPTREGHKFLGWNDTIPTNMPAHNLAIKAIWANVTSPSDSIEIVFGTKDLSNDEIKEIIQKYAGGGYRITNITHTNDGVSVIVEFNDVAGAMSFVENIRESSEMDEMIAGISFIDENKDSFSTRSVPLFFLIIFSVLFTLI